MAKREAAETVKKNLRRVQTKEAALCESKLLFADDICAKVLPQTLREFRAGGRLDPDWIAERASAYLPSFSAAPVAENAAAVSAALSAGDGIFAAECCYQLSCALENALRKKDFLPAAFGGGRIGACKCVSMIKADTFSDIFTVLQNRKKGLTAFYGQSFADVLERVEDGSADGCILPIENDRDGALIGAWKSICAQDLFLSHICVKNDSSGASAKFALLCRGFSDIIESSEQMRLYLRLVCNASFHRLLSVLPVLRVELRSTFSIPLSYTDGNAQICAFGGTDAALFSLLLWLCVMKADATLLGICSEEEE